MPRHAVKLDHGPPTPLALRILQASNAHASMRAFARRCEVEYQNLWRYAHQNVKPGPAVIAKIAKGAGVTTDWLLTGEGRAPRAARATKAA